MSEQDNKQITNPMFAQAQRAYNEEIAQYVISAKNWRFFALGLLLVTTIAVGGVAYIGSQSKIKPFVVTIDKLGTPIGVQEIPQLIVDHKVVKFTLANFIFNSRSVYLFDPQIQRKRIKDAYVYLDSLSPATTKITKMYQENPPFGRENGIDVEVESVIDIGNSQYQADWSETEVTKEGLEVQKNHYRAIVTIFLQEPTTDKEIFANPIGLFIKDINLQKTNY